MSDRAVLAVINPPASQRDRSALTTAPIRPGQNNRTGLAIGASFSPGRALTVTSNHFPLRLDACPNTITYYHVHLYRVGQDGHNRSEDVAGDEDARKTVQVMKTLRDKHPAWTATGMGFAYDTKSALYTTRHLGLTEFNHDGQLFHSEIVGLPDRNGTQYLHGKHIARNAF
jgi:hypothetical protein